MKLAILILTFLAVSSFANRPNRPVNYGPGKNRVQNGPCNGDYASLTDAVNQANDGDTIELCPGHYKLHQKLEVTKSLRFRGPRPDPTPEAPWDPLNGPAGPDGFPPGPPPASPPVNDPNPPVDGPPNPPGGAPNPPVGNPNPNPPVGTPNPNPPVGTPNPPVPRLGGKRHRGDRPSDNRANIEGTVEVKAENVVFENVRFWLDHDDSVRVYARGVRFVNVRVVYDEAPALLLHASDATVEGSKFWQWERNHKRDQVEQASAAAIQVSAEFRDVSNVAVRRNEFVGQNTLELVADSDNWLDGVEFRDNQVWSWSENNNRLGGRNPPQQKTLAAITITSDVKQQTSWLSNVNIEGNTFLSEDDAVTVFVPQNNEQGKHHNVYLAVEGLTIRNNEVWYAGANSQFLRFDATRQVFLGTSIEHNTVSTGVGSFLAGGIFFGFSLRKNDLSVFDDVFVLYVGSPNYVGDFEIVDNVATLTFDDSKKRQPAGPPVPVNPHGPADGPDGPAGGPDDQSNSDFLSGALYISQNVVVARNTVNAVTPSFNKAV